MPVWLGSVALVALLALSVRAQDSAVHRLPPVDGYAAQPVAFYDTFLADDEEGRATTTVEERLCAGYSGKTPRTETSQCRYGSGNNT